MLQIGLKFKEENSEVLHLEHWVVCCWNMDTSESRLEISGKFWNVVLEKDGEDQLVKWTDHVRVKEDRNILYAVQRREAN
jgi:hypothetical protein